MKVPSVGKKKICDKCKVIHREACAGHLLEPETKQSRGKERDLGGV